MADHQPEILLVTFPSQGHINPSLQFAKRLISIGVHVTFMTAASAIHLMNKTSPLQGLSYAYFSDGYDHCFQLTDDSNHYMAEIKRCGSQTLREFLAQSIDRGTNFTCIVYCTLVPWVATVAREFHIPTTLLWNQPASLLNIYYHYFKGYDEIISKDINDPSFLVKIPGLPLLSRHDLPSFFIPPNSHVMSLLAFKAHIEILDQETNPRVLVNTFDVLEAEAIKAIDKYYKLVGIGPLIPTAFLGRKKLAETSSGGDLFKVTKEYREMEWLNSKPERSVIYVSFGSLSVLAKPQMEELAKGLLDTGRPFLWVIRESGEEKEEEMEGLTCQKDLEKQGMIVPWCSQVEVLSHPSVGCFVTHCGWNSTFESLVSGVPMVTFPQWTDQGTNSKLVQDAWKTGVRLTKNEEGIVEGREIKRCLEMVMGGDMRGEEIRRNARKWKDLAREAAMEGGSSNANLKAFVVSLETLK
ncbi:crocetin glucosyltransferase, chloroplastic-like [Durio zibethinus]|uniref:Glycosyltransferase n=1 Tax=Durio zibethinus TaxID=66656 RepID=A0A6P5YJI5_DURZI|nr:crocetin glucosyltransferase, chloroplastic-like [Durio zibethinus]